MDDAVLASVLEGLTGPGFVILPGAWPTEEVDALRQEALTGWNEGAFHRAGIGRGEVLGVRSEIRRDSTQWLDPADLSPATKRWWSFLDTLRALVNRELFLGLVDAEAHFAVYPAGAFYGRHLDRFRDNDARTLSCLLYLNDTWSSEDGGALRLYPPDGGTSLDVLPRGGTVVVFRSDTIEHEVLPAHRLRLSLTCWLRRRS